MKQFKKILKILFKKVKYTEPKFFAKNEKDEENLKKIRINYLKFRDKYSHKNNIAKNFESAYTCLNNIMINNSLGSESYNITTIEDGKIFINTYFYLLIFLTANKIFEFLIQKFIKLLIF